VTPGIPVLNAQTFKLFGTFNLHAAGSAIRSTRQHGTASGNRPIFNFGDASTRTLILKNINMFCSQAYRNTVPDMPGVVKAVIPADLFGVLVVVDHDAFAAFTGGGLAAVSSGADVSFGQVRR